MRFSQSLLAIGLCAAPAVAEAQTPAEGYAYMVAISTFVVKECDWTLNEPQIKVIAKRMGMTAADFVTGGKYEAVMKAKFDEAKVDVADARAESGDTKSFCDWANEQLGPKGQNTVLPTAGR